MAHLTVIRMPDGSLIAVNQIGRVARFDAGVGILNQRDKMIAWLETNELPQDDQAPAQAMISTVLEELINNPRRAKQPDWSFLAVTPLTTAAQPVRKVEQPASEPKRTA
jgi:hypothetical protein